MNYGYISCSGGMYGQFGVVLTDYDVVIAN